MKLGDQTQTVVISRHDARLMKHQLLLQHHKQINNYHRLLHHTTTSSLECQTRDSFFIKHQPTITNHYDQRSKLRLFWLPFVRSTTIAIYTLILVVNFTLGSIHAPHELNVDGVTGCQRQVKIEPIFLTGTGPGNSSSSPLSSGLNCDTKLKISFAAFGETFVINLIRNERLISDKYFKNSQQNSYKNSFSEGQQDFQKHKHMFLILNNITNKNHCHFQEDPHSSNYISAISVVDRAYLSGYFYNRFYSYYLHADAANNVTILERECPDDIAISPPTKSRFRRDVSPNQISASEENHIKHGPFQSNSSSLYVELLVVHDHSQFLEYKKDTVNIAERTMQIVNIMNAFYRQLNIFIALSGVVLWTEKDEIQLTDDGDATLNNFLKYRYEKLLPRYHHDNAQLITSTSFNGSVVGKALKGPICTHEHSGGVNTDHSHNPAIVAVTLAHELGHNFGMEHDEDETCVCPDEKCIMSSSSTIIHPKHWSSCSIKHLQDARERGLLNCLIDMPEKVFGPICGNGFVEEGEDCDLGESIPSYGSSKSRKSSSSSSGQKCVRGQDCETSASANPCCDRQTCKFIGNATCAQGSCCDLTKCSVYNGTETRVCRERKGECDLEEVCDGQSEYCPADVHYHNGIECGPNAGDNGVSPMAGSLFYNRTKAYCYNGECASHQTQCELLWGVGASVSQDICFEQNTHGNTSGNCGYNRRDKVYESCEPEEVICGMLHCVHGQNSEQDLSKTGKLRHGFESASILTVSYYVSSRSKTYCHGAIIDGGPSVRDPGLVPNGASCGDDKMCLNQKCVPVYDVIYNSNHWCPSDCNGNGICDNVGVCHCNDGTIGTSCYRFFGPHFHLSLILYFITFFIPMIALIIFTVNYYKDQIKIWWFLHNRRSELRQKARETSHPTRRINYEAGCHKVVISDPIPLSQHNNTNRPFHDSYVDPWAEKDGLKSPGYKLEPLPRAGQEAASVKFSIDN